MLPILPQADRKALDGEMLPFNRNSINSKVRTDHATNITSGTLIIIINTYRMITTTINISGLTQNMFRTKINAEAALLAPFCYNNNPFFPSLQITATYIL